MVTVNVGRLRSNMKIVGATELSADKVSVRTRLGNKTGSVNKRNAHNPSANRLNVKSTSANNPNVSRLSVRTRNASVLKENNLSASRRSIKANNVNARKENSLSAIMHSVHKINAKRRTASRPNVSRPGILKGVVIGAMRDGLHNATTIAMPPLGVMSLVDRVGIAGAHVTMSNHRAIGGAMIAGHARGSTTTARPTFPSIDRPMSFPLMGMAAMALPITVRSDVVVTLLARCWVASRVV